MMWWLCEAIWWRVIEDHHIVTLYKLNQIWRDLLIDEPRRNSNTPDGWRGSSYVEGYSIESGHIYLYV